MLYFPATFVVVSSVKRRDFIDENMTPEEIKNVCTIEYGGGIQFKMKSYYSYLLKFRDILEYRETLFFYSTVPNQRMRIVKKFMRNNKKDMSRLGGITARFLNEFLGDPTSFLDVSNTYNRLRHKEDLDAKLEAYRAAPISRKRVTEYLELADKHPPFVEF